MASRPVARVARLLLTLSPQCAILGQAVVEIVARVARLSYIPLYRNTYIYTHFSLGNVVCCY